jgi:hypothetical protein
MIVADTNDTYFEASSAVGREWERSRLPQSWSKLVEAADRQQGARPEHVQQ